MVNASTLASFAQITYIGKWHTSQAKHLYSHKCKVNSHQFEQNFNLCNIHEIYLCTQTQFSLLIGIQSDHLSTWILFFQIEYRSKFCLLQHKLLTYILYLCILSYCKQCSQIICNICPEFLWNNTQYWKLIHSIAHCVWDLSSSEKKSIK